MNVNLSSFARRSCRSAVTVQSSSTHAGCNIHGFRMTKWDPYLAHTSQANAARRFTISTKKVPRAKSSESRGLQHFACERVKSAVQNSNGYQRRSELLVLPTAESRQPN